MSWHSTAMYYQYINEEISRRLGRQHSADIVLKSLDFESVLIPWQQGNWEAALKLIIMSLKEIEAAGADFFLLCSNAVHKLADKLSHAANIPMLHIGEVVSNELYQNRLKAVGLLGTQVTMESNFYHQYLEKKGIKIVLPSESDRSIVDELVFTELIKGKFTDNTRIQFEKIIDEMHNNGAKGIILGCTELPLLFSKKQYKIPMFDTLKLHAFAAVDEALKESIDI